MYEMQIKGLEDELEQALGELRGFKEE